jgi:riboflavin kinase/FMN adenylyltransferase
MEQIEKLGMVGEPLFLALGVFDGVHVGHRAVIGRAVDAAAAIGGAAGVVTFEPHPIRVLAPEKAPRRLLASVEHKESLLADLGVDVMLVVRFDPEFARTGAAEFVGALAGAAGDLRMLVVGEDWKFGRGRGGDVGFLRGEGGRLGFDVAAVPPVMMDGERVSSTRIRQAIRDGSMEAAARMLGRRHSVVGRVVEGRRLGRTIGFPTVNLAIGEEQMPPDGVWTVRVKVAGEWRGGVANLGRRPTVEGGGVRTLEAHIFDFSADIYGEWIEVEFGEFLRGERKFSGVEELREQIRKDARRARERIGI